MPFTESDHNAQFLSGGGEMGELTRKKDWSKTSLGPPGTWPQSLRTTLGIILHSRFPMFLWWGPELICFYNDAYRPSLGNEGKHPAILGQPAEEAWQEIWHIIKPLIDQVLGGGGSVWSEDQLIPIFRNGRIEDVYWTFSYSPVFDETGKAAGVLVTCTETTEKVNTFRALKKSEQRFRSIINQAPMGITIMRGPEFMVEMANDTYLQIVDRKEEDFVGRSLFDSLPEVKDAVAPLLTSVLKTGVPYYGNEFPVMLHRYGREDSTYFNFVYDALREDDGTIYGIIAVAMEVTELTRGKQFLAESEKNFRNMVIQSPIAMTIFKGPDLVIEMANDVLLRDIWQKKEEEVINKKLLEVFPELNDQKYPQLMYRVIETGETYRENESIAFIHGNSGLRKFYLDYEYAPLREKDGTVSGILVTVSDVTEKVEARLKIEASEEKLNIVIAASELGTWELNLKDGTVQYSDRYLEIFGYPTRVDLTHEQLVQHLHPDDLPIRKEAFKKAFETGMLHYESRLVWKDQSIHWMEGKGKVFYNDQNQPAQMIGTIRDITEEKNHRQRLKEREQKFRLLADSMPQFVWTSDAEGNMNYFNQSVFDYAGLSVHQLRQDGWLQIVHPDDREENIRLWMEAVTTGQDFLCEHRFRRHDGTYRWQLSRAIPQKDATGNIRMWVGTSTDIQEQKTFTQELEKLVQERTRMLQETNEKLEISISDLQKMNTELQSFAYVSSHDLQEPLRKIQAFAGRIQEREAQNLSDTGKDYLNRMQDAARRMQTLIEDLLMYSRTNTTERVFKKVNIRDLLLDVKNDFKELLQEKHGIIEIGEMGELNLIPFQFSQLMHNLIGNALKFSKPGIPPFVRITSELVGGGEAGVAGLSPQKRYFRLSVSDNGIGFSPQYKERIFEVFQRLHGRSEYPGTGIGLAIVKKIVDNHNGAIEAIGEEGEGARFDVYIPV